MTFHSVRADDVLQLAHDFRQRAAETEDTTYYCLMLRTAAELEELADNLANKKDSELVLVEGDDDATADPT
jgi:hypothetical protein